VKASHPRRLKELIEQFEAHSRRLRLLQRDEEAKAIMELCLHIVETLKRLGRL